MAHLLHRIASYRDSDGGLGESGGTADLADELLDGIEDYENDFIGEPSPIRPISSSQSGPGGQFGFDNGGNGFLAPPGRSPGGPLRYRRQISFNDSASAVRIHSGGGETEQIVQAAMDKDAMPASSVYFDDRTLAERLMGWLPPRLAGRLMVLSLLCYICWFYVDPSRFRYTVFVPDMFDEVTCVAFCKQTQSHNDLLPGNPSALDCSNAVFTDNRVPYNSEWRGRPWRAHANGRATCEFQVVPEAWRPWVTINVLVATVMILAEGARPDLTFFGSIFALTALDVLAAKEAFAGLSSTAALSIALFFPLITAVDETGALESMVPLVLGRPSYTRVAIMRLSTVVFACSVFLPNNPLVALFLPLVVTWARRAQLPLEKLLMPMSFSIQLGGACSKIGSSGVLVAADATKDYYTMQFFDLLPAGALIGAGMTCIMCLTKDFMKASDANKATEMKEKKETPPDPECYRIKVICGPMVANEEIQNLALDKLQGVHAVKRLQELKGLFHTKEKPCPACEAFPLLLEGEHLTCWVTPKGIASLRSMRGLDLANKEDFPRTSSQRKFRALYEVVVQARSPAEGLVDLNWWKRKLGAVPISRRGDPPWLTAADKIIGGGDVLVVEADKRMVEKPGWARCFLVAAQVPGSTPPRCSYPVDNFRSSVVVAGFIIFITLTVLQMVSLVEGAGAFLFALLAFKVIDVDSVLPSMNTQVLLTVAGSIGLAQALKCGVTQMVAREVLAFALPFGRTPLLLGLYVVTSMLGTVIQSAGLMALLMPVGMSIASNPKLGLSHRCIASLIIYAACFSAATPVGFPGNLLIQRVGQYTFTDFVRYGGLMQICHGILVVLIVPVVDMYLLPPAD
jgi:di/tricarboxylate transporter